MKSSQYFVGKYHVDKESDVRHFIVYYKRGCYRNANAFCVHFTIEEEQAWIETKRKKKKKW